MASNGPHTPAARAKMSEAARSRSVPAARRFFDRFEYELNTGCWLWTGTAGKAGYGVIKVCGEVIGAHRFSYQHHRGPIPADLMVCHRCDTPACVNPAHLFLGSAADNAQDMAHKGRRASRSGSRNASARLTEADVRTIFARIQNGDPLQAIAADYGIVATAISAIKRGMSWNHVTGLPKRRLQGRGFDSPRTGARP